MRPSEVCFSLNLVSVVFVASLEAVVVDVAVAAAVAIAVAADN